MLRRLPLAAAAAARGRWGVSQASVGSRWTAPSCDHRLSLLDFLFMHHLSAVCVARAPGSGRSQMPACGLGLVRNSVSRDTGFLSSYISETVTQSSTRRVALAPRFSAATSCGMDVALPLDVINQGGCTVTPDQIDCVGRFDPGVLGPPDIGSQM